MLIQLCCVAAIIACVFCDDPGAAACSLDLVWPPPDAIVLIGPGSKMVVAYVKLAGTCSEFFPLDQFWLLQVGIVSYFSNEIRDAQMLQRISASPLTDDYTPISFRMMRSRLLVDNRTSKLPQGQSIWLFSLVYPWLNVEALHHPDSEALTIEIHLVSNFSTPVAKLRVPATTLRMRLFGHPSAHFHTVRPRYTSIPGYVCRSSCGNLCSSGTQSQEQLLLLRPYESPVCVPIAHALKNTEWMLDGPSFNMRHTHHVGTHASVQADRDEIGECSSDVVVVSIGASSDVRVQHGEIVVEGPGRSRLLSVIAAALTRPFGFLFLKSHRLPFNEARVRNSINAFDLHCSYAFIAFHHQRIQSSSSQASPRHTLLADFGSIDDGILLSRSAAELIVMAANDQSFMQLTDELPDPCSEFAIFSDAWLCWCASSLDVSTLDILFGAAGVHDEPADYDCAGPRALFDKIDQQQLNELSAFQDETQSQTSSDYDNYDQPPSFENDTSTRRFKHFAQQVSHQLTSVLAIHLSTGLHDNETHFFWGACFSRFIVDVMTRQERSQTKLIPEQPGGHPTVMSSNIAVSLAEPLLDNEHLQLVTSSHQTVMSFDRSLQVAASFAWIVTGVWRGQRSVATLHLLRDVVCAGLGQGHAHFYFVMSNMEEGQSSAMTGDRRLEIRKFIEDTLPSGSVMLVLFQEKEDRSGWRGRTSASPQFCNFCDTTGFGTLWCLPLQSAYNYITATETYQFYRYAFVVVSRTDSHYVGPIASAQKWHDVIPKRGIIGSRWNFTRGKIEWGKDDSFFVLRRCHAAAALLHFPAFTYRLIKRESMSSSIKDRAIWSYSYCWAEAAVAYFFTASRWSVGSMEVMDLCELGLVGQLQTHMNSGIRYNCPEPILHSTVQG
jgi:hypothetical protein